MDCVKNELHNGYISEDSSQDTSKSMNSENITKDVADISDGTLVAFSREITKRLEITKRYEYDMMKLKLDHEIEFIKNIYCSVM